MKKLLVGLLVLGSCSIYASDIITVKAPEINNQKISVRSNKNGVCKALINEYSSYVEGSLEVSIVRLRLGDPSCVNCGFIESVGGAVNSIKIDGDGEIVKNNKRRKKTISKISCYK